MQAYFVNHPIRCQSSRTKAEWEGRHSRVEIEKVNIFLVKTRYLQAGINRSFD